MRLIGLSWLAAAAYLYAVVDGRADTWLLDWLLNLDGWRLGL